MSRFIGLKVFQLLALAALQGFAIYDLIEDAQHNPEIGHIVVEGLVLAVFGYLMYLVFRDLRKSREDIRRITAENERLQAWYDESKLDRERLRAGIETQFAEWGLSFAETRVAFLVIRGFSFQQIANLLGRSERTVRKQATEVYRKTGFPGRAEFVGFFLESVFELGDEPSFAD